MPRNRTANKVATKPVKGKMTLTPKVVPIRNQPRTINIDFTPKTENQKLFIKLLDSYEVVLANGSAGVGKTMTAIAYALKTLFENKIERIILTRPFVTCGEDYGALPGDANDKLGPIMASMTDILYHFLGEALLDNLMETGKIEIKPLGFIRGLSFHDSIVICDEVQNIEKLQLLTLATRVGENCKLILCSDDTQTDIPKHKSGLIDFMKRIKGESDFGLIEFTPADCLRSRMARRIIEIYEKNVD